MSKVPDWFADYLSFDWHDEAMAVRLTWNGREYGHAVGATEDQRGSARDVLAYMAFAQFGHRMGSKA